MIKDNNLTAQYEGLNCLLTFVKLGKDIKSVTFSCHSYLLDKVQHNKQNLREHAMKKHGVEPMKESEFNQADNPTTSEARSLADVNNDDEDVITDPTEPPIMFGGCQSGSCAGAKVSIMDWSLRSGGPVYFYLGDEASKDTGPVKPERKYECAWR